MRRNRPLLTAACLAVAIPVCASIALLHVFAARPWPAAVAAQPSPVGQAPPLAAGAAWELRLLGLDTPDKLRQLRELSAQRPVILADVGTGGVSAAMLADRLDDNFSIEYRMGPGFPNCDPKADTHDTQMIRCIADITRALGIKIKLLVYQPADDSEQIGEAFARAADHADIICFYQSYWDLESTDFYVTESPEFSPAACELVSTRCSGRPIRL